MNPAPSEERARAVQHAGGLRGGLAAVRGFLGLNRNVGVLAASIFLIGLGEELWQTYLPVYLTALGASGLVVGMFASGKDLLDGLYQYPGGWIADRFGRRRALIVSTLLAMAGYATYAAAAHWAVVFVGLAGAMAWKAGAFPATFAVVGDALPSDRRAMAFSVQSVLVRLPRVISAPLGGLLLAALGVVAGVRVALGVTLALALVALWLQHRGYQERPSDVPDYAPVPARRVLAQMPGALKRLLVADGLVRFGEGIAAAFIVLYVLDTLRLPAPAYGVLYAIQQSVAIALYLPAGRMADVTGRRPMVALTFVFFALFPLAVHLSRTFPALALAFVVGGMKEMGEPARKALIVDLAEPAQRGRAVGVYYAIRNLLVMPAGAVGGLLWQRQPHLPLQVAFIVGMLGVLFFVVTTAGEDRKST